MMKYNKCSVIIPTYRRPDALELCIKSIIEGQVLDNEIIVVVDGFYEYNKEVLDKFENKIKIINFAQNVGLCKGTNFGVYGASNEVVLIANDDNVFPKEWDKRLLETFNDDMVLTPNQIEPHNNIFNQFSVKDFGKDPSKFNIEEFYEYEKFISRHEKMIDNTGGTLPFMITKTNYMMLGGWDENYPLGLTADWDFFYKCQLLGLNMYRHYGIHVYHFESLSTRKDESHSRLRDEQQAVAIRYCMMKWGGYLHNDNNNLKVILKNEHN